VVNIQVVRPFKVSGVLVALAVVAAGCGDDDAAEVQTSGQSVEQATASVDEALSRVGQITAWTEAGLFVYGGVDETRESVGGAALIDPDTGESVALPEPFEHPIRRVGVAAPVEGGVFLMGELCEETIYEEDLVYCVPGGLVASSYSIADGAWTPIDIPDELQAGPTASWVVNLLGVSTTGTLVLEIVLEGNREIGDEPFWSFEPDGAAWTRLADPGVDFDDSCLAGDHVVVVGSTPTAGGGSYSGTTLHTLSVMTPDGPWDPLEPLDEVTWSNFPLVSCGGLFAVVYGSASDSTSKVAFRQSIDPAGDWQDVSPFPEVLVFVDHAIWTGDQLVLFGESGEAVALSDGGWMPVDLPRGPVGSDPVWTGDEFVVIDPTTATGTSSGELSVP